MNSQYKVCPRCNTPADLHAAQCLTCGRTYNTKFPQSTPPEEKTQTFTAPLSATQSATTNNGSGTRGIKWGSFALALCWLCYKINGCASTPDVNILELINQPETVIEQKLGKPIPVSGDAQLQLFPAPNGIEAVYVLFAPNASKIIVQFSNTTGTSLSALERVGLGENGISRGPDIEEGNGWTYINQKFGDVTFARVKTIGGTGNYKAVSAELPTAEIELPKPAITYEAAPRYDSAPVSTLPPGFSPSLPYPGAEPSNARRAALPPAIPTSPGSGTPTGNPIAPATHGGSGGGQAF